MTDAGECAASASPGAASEAHLSHHSHHPRSFKLRFAAQREPGRSYVSPVKPLGLPATVTDKFYARRDALAPAGDERWERALRRIRLMFSDGPREKHAHPVTGAHEVGWWWREGAAREAEAWADRRRSHHLRDSPWLKARLLVLAADARLARR